MNKIVLYNPSITTLNLGDKIIFDSVYSELKPLFSDSFVVDVSTHLPVSDVFVKLLSDADMRFVCGTNLLRNSLERKFKQWDINIFNAKRLGPCVLVGVGRQKDRWPLTPYTKLVYKNILDKEKIHSVRDSYTKVMLNRLGFKNVINTGCPTMWSLTEEHCKKIKTEKAQDAVFTFTKYNDDVTKDQMVINVLSHEYRNVYIWMQGYKDGEYMNSFELPKNTIIISPNVESYDHVLNNYDVDYFGTRLHGGIRALQKGHRTMILAVDYRAEAKKKDFNLPVFSRSSLDEDILRKLIYEKRITDIHIPTDEINKWKRAYGLA